MKKILIWAAIVVVLIAAVIAKVLLQPVTQKTVISVAQVATSTVTTTTQSNIETAASTTAPIATPLPTTTFKALPVATSAVSLYPDGYTVDNILALINAQRLQNGLVALKLNKNLSTAAEGRTADMVNLSYFSHTSPDGNDYSTLIKKTLYEPMLPADIIAAMRKALTITSSTQRDAALLAIDKNACSTYGENLAISAKPGALGETITDAKGKYPFGYLTPDGLISAWMNSPEHRANILGSNYTETGISFAYGVYEGNATLFIAQEFGGYVPCNVSTSTTK